MFFILLQGCSSVAVQTASLLTRQPTEFSRPQELVDTAFFPQKDYQCGPAALATVLNSAGRAVVAEDLVDRVFIPDRKGSLQIEMLAATREQGMVPYIINTELESLLKEVQAGNPVLVLQNLALEWYPQWHYAVVVGYDLAKGTLYLRSGTIKRHVMDMHTFEHTWRRAKFWGFVALPPDRLPATAEPHAYMRSILPFEEKKNWPVTVQAYHTALQRWPDNLNLLMGIANVQLQMNNHMEAEKSYREVLKYSASFAPAMNNLAESLLRQGKLKEAESWAVKAVNAGGRYAGVYQQTLDEIKKKIK